MTRALPFALAFLAAPALAQIVIRPVVITTVQQLPASPEDGRPYIVTDGLTASDCDRVSGGGGSHVHWCLYDADAGSYSAVESGAGADSTCLDAGVDCPFAGSATEGGAATSALDLSCSGCVAASEVAADVATQAELDAVAGAETDNQDGTEVPYTPTTAGDWTDPDPVHVAEGLDDLAGRVTVDEAALTTHESVPDAHFDHADTLAELNTQIGASLADGAHSSPGGAGTELQYRAGASTFGALTGSSVSPPDISLGGTVAMVDNTWLGLGAAAGRIEFDDLATDEVNVLSARLGIGTSTPSTTLHASAAAGSGHVFTVTNSTVGSGFSGSFNLEAPALSATNRVFFNIGKAASTNNRFALMYRHSADGSSANLFSIGAFGNDDILVVEAQGDIGIGTITPDADLHVIGGVCVEASDSGCAPAAGAVRASVYSAAPGTATCPSSGDANPGTLFISASATYTEITSSDPDGCTVTVAEPSAGGQMLTLALGSTAGGVVTLSDAAGSVNLSADWTPGPGDTLSMIYSQTRSEWLETARSDN